MSWSTTLLSRNTLAEIPLAQLTTMRIGGLAQVLTLETVEDLPEVMACREKYILGKGANILASDDPIRLPVLRLGKYFSQCQWQGSADAARLRVGAAHDLALLIGRCCREGWAGLEGLAGVPATVGGALCMNAGTASRWIFDVVDQVQVLLPEADQPRWFARSECQAQYRSSGFPAGTFFIACDLLLKPGDPAALKAQAKALKTAKAASQPLSAASAGCIFKNPSADLGAGKLIDELGLKGQRRGGAQISEQHANFIVNTGAATAQDVAALVRLIRARAQAERGIDLQLEVQRWQLPDQLFEPNGEER